MLTQTYQVSSGNILLPTEAVKDLGVMVTSDLSWKPHVSIIAQRATKVAALLPGCYLHLKQETNAQC